jgi:DNA-binding NarL/FixJ family response regulator
MDLMLPDGDGETVLKRVRQRGLQTRVIVCAATFDRARMDPVAGLGPDAILQKPIDIVATCRACGTTSERVWKRMSGG